MRYEHSGVLVSEDVLLGQPLGQLQVVRLVRHLLGLPLPQHLLFQLAEHTEEHLSLLIGHLGRLQHGPG